MKSNNVVQKLSIVLVLVAAVSVGVYLFVSDVQKTGVAPVVAQNQEAVATQAELTTTVIGNNEIENFSVGPKDAKVTVTEFFDPECETCAQVSPVIKNEIAYYNSKVRWVFRYMAYHPNSFNAIKILEAARKQNLYFEAMALLFSKQSQWGARHDGGGHESPSKEKELLKIISTLPGIKMKQLESDRQNPLIQKLVDNDKSDGVRAGVSGTPTFFVNGKIIDPLNLDRLIERIDAALK